MNQSFVWTWNGAALECFDTQFRDDAVEETTPRGNRSGYDFVLARAEAERARMTWLDAAGPALERR